MDVTDKFGTKLAVASLVAIIAGTAAGCGGTTRSATAASGVRAAAATVSGSAPSTTTGPALPTETASTSAVPPAATSSESGGPSSPGAVGPQDRPASPSSRSPVPVPTTTVPSHPSTTATGIPESVMITPAQLPGWANNRWSQLKDDHPAISALTDPDPCDPVKPTSSTGESPYPGDLHPSDALARTWMGPQSALTTEAVITYSSRSGAEADFSRHQSWLANCASAFSWTDMPHAQTVTPVPLANGDHAYALRVAMYAPNQPASTAGSQGYVYLAVVQRGNAVAFLITTAESGALVPSPADPGPSWTASTEATVDSLLATAFPAR